MRVRELRAGDLMTDQLVTIAPGETLRAAAQLMERKHIHCLLVPAQEANRCLGVLTGKDIVQVLCEGDETLLEQLRVSDVMTAPAISVQQDFLIADCIRLMRMSGVRSVPVLSGSVPVGVLSFSDVLRAVAQP